MNTVSASDFRAWLFAEEAKLKELIHQNLGLRGAYLSPLVNDGNMYPQEIQKMTTPRTYSLMIAAKSSWADNTIAIKDDCGRSASFTQISNAGSGLVTVRLNQDDHACFVLEAGSVQVFNSGDLILDRIEFLGSDMPTRVDVILGV